MEKSLDSLNTARREAELNPAASIGRAYYACFYVASAVLILQRRKFARHAGVESALNQHLVREGIVAKAIGQLYRKLLESRQQADYDALISWTPDDSHTRIREAETVIAALKKLVPTECLPPDFESGS